MSARISVLWVTCAVPLLAMASCSTDQRDLEFGFGHGSSTSLGPPSAGSGGADAGAPSTPEGGDSAMPIGGTSSVAGGGNGGLPSTPTDGGDDAGGQPSGQAGTSPGGSGGSGAGGSGSTAGAGGSGGGAGSGGSGGTSIDTGPCGDLDQNGVQDCEETLAQNSRFDTTAQSWVADPSVTSTWRAEDARGLSGSGSIGISFATSGGDSTWGLAAASQCQPAWSDDIFVVGARLMIPQGQAGGRAQLELAFFDNDNCKGTVLSSQAAAISAEQGAWHALSKTVQIPPGTRSVMLRLAAAKPGTQASLEVRFDDVLFRKK